MKALDFKKKPYATPEMKVYQVKSANIIATSTRANSNEEYETGSVDGWY